MAGWAAIALTALPAKAQLELIPDTAPDRSLSTQVLQNALPNGDVITGGTRSTNGQNLFHSFQEFNIRENRGVYFQNPTGVQNILTRVTGRDPSDILGTLGVLGSANLFLLNPNGIFFGPNARLQINGSFVASTANSFRFSDGSEFGANNSLVQPLLTVNITPGLQAGTISPGSAITNRGNLVAGQDLILEGDRLDVQGQLIAGRDLTLKARDTVQIRDTATTPFLARSGRDLTVQGNQGVDILALNTTPQSPPSLTPKAHTQRVLGGEGEVAFQSGRNLSLISDGIISGDAHFSSGGEFRVRSVSGKLATLTSLYDPIISSAGNVDIAAGYTGASLLIESQGSVRIQGDVFIDAPDIVSTFIGDDAILSTQPGLIIRSGQTALRYGGNNQNPPDFDNDAVPPRITLDSPVRVVPNALGGTVKLTADNGGITFYSIDASSRTGGTGGNIELTAKGDIHNTGFFIDPAVGFVGALGSFSYSYGGNGGNGGSIAVTSMEGNIRLEGEGAISYSYSYSDSKDFADNPNTGGGISFNTQSGDITLTNLSLVTYSFSFTDSAGNGGPISFNTQSGNINLEGVELLSSSISAIDGYDSGNGGAVSFNTQSGTISVTSSEFQTISDSNSAKGGNGGAISFYSNSGNLSLKDSRLQSSASSFSGYAGNGGAISLHSNSGNIYLTNSVLDSSSSVRWSSGTAGNGGAISLSAREGIISGGLSVLNSFAVSVLNDVEVEYSTPSEGISGNGGKVTLEANSRISGLTVNTIASDGKSGDVQINGNGNLAIDQINILTAQQVAVCFRPPCSDSTPPTIINLGNRGQAGDVRIDSSGDLTFRNSVIQSDTRSGNPAGNITITSPGVISFNNSQFSSNTSGSGKAGDISINAPVVNLTAQSQIQAQTTETSSGRGGSITINAPTAVALTRTADGNPVISVKTSGAGKAGDITINTPVLTLSDAAEITATATQSSTSREGGGSITLNASSLNLAGIVGVFAETQGQAPAGTLNLNPYSNQADLQIALTPNSQISASTSGSGNGGDLLVFAPRSITIAGPGKLAVETSSTGDAGNMTITTSQLSLSNGVELSASTFGAGTAGEVQINADDLTIAGGARILTNTSGSGQAGDLIINVSDRLLLTAPGTGLFASTTPGSTGSGGNIIIDPRLVQIENGAAIAVDSQGSGTGGSISLRAGRLELRDRGLITAETASAQGGNITLNVQGLILLRRNSLISATAGTAQAGGDGGNINIRSAFIIGVLGENSDITANAFTGRGGNITITTNAIFGLRSQPQLTPFSDITASSQFGLSGSIAINTLNVDPNRGLVALPTNLTDTSRQIREACTPSSTAIARKNSFVVVGRGGLPVSPDAAQTGDRPLVDLVSVVPSNTDQARSLPESPIDAADESQGAIVEAQGWTTGKDGTVFLTAHTNVNSVHAPGLPLPTCISR
ncbi:MAG: filamentous hemagglutinin N-terminal domain-containing protein [Leptolyngbyaceae cyanobacterium bins.302]|nr:filamentous hemagglutinin N-terminal domain-containing protein [Leptolyngbyaceae cyanobacterium bins.302]